MGVLPQSSGIKASKGRLSLESLNALFLPSRRGVVTLFVSTLNGFQLRHNFEIGSELKIDWSNNQGKESQNAKLGVPTTLPFQKDFRYFFFRWNKDVVFPPRFGCFASISITFLKNLTFTLLLSSLRLELIGMASITVYPKLLKMGIVDKTLSQQFKQFNKLGTKLTFFGIAKMKTKSLQI